MLPQSYLPFFLPAQPRRVGGVVQVSNKIRPTTTIINQTTDRTSLIIFFIILILQMDYGIFLDGEVSLPGFD